MRKIFCLVAILVIFSACEPEDMGFFEPAPIETGDGKDNDDDNKKGDDEQKDDDEYLPDDGSLISGEPPYELPRINTENDFQLKIYFDPDYTGGNSDGSIERPFTNINSQFSGEIPPNTAFLFKRGTTHERIGHTGGIGLQGMIYNNNMIGAYGEGDNPIIQGIWIASNSDGLTIRDLNIQAESLSGAAQAQDIIINLWSGDGSRPKNITIAFNTINGVYNPNGAWTDRGPRPYPWMGIRGGGNRITIYCNIISNVGDDGMRVDAHEGYVIVRNYVFNVNRRHWGQNIKDSNRGGDAILLAWSFCGAYVAGNYLDPARDYYDEHPNGDDYWKHSYIANASPTGGWDSPTSGITTEYNTFISPPTNSFGSGGVIYYNPPKNSTFRYNLITPTEGKTGRGAIRSSGFRIHDHLNQSQPYGIYENHIVSEDSRNLIYPDDDQLVLDCGNLIFDSFADYHTYIETNNPVGSDIDPDDFWNGYPFK